MVAILQLKRIDDEKVNHKLRRLPTQTTPMLKNPRNPVNPDSKAYSRTKFQLSSRLNRCIIKNDLSVKKRSPFKN